MSTTDAALRLLARARSSEDVRAAVDAAPPGDFRLREGLLARFQSLMAAGPRLDPTATVRTEILIAFRESALAADGPMLENAATTYEFGYSGEVAGRLRGAAIAALGMVDPARARAHAVRLLADPHNQEMSGEPALSAVRLLADHGELLALYRHALQGSDGEVLAECLRSLTDLPAGLVALLVESLRKSRNEVVLLGVVDLLFSHPDGSVAASFLPGWMAAEAPEDIYRYAATAAVASRRPELVAMVRELAGTEIRRERLAILEEALSL